MSANPAPPPLATLTEEERVRALARYHLLQPHLEGGVALTTLARAHAVPLRTAQRWVTRYRQEGLAGQPFQHRHCWTSCQNVDP